MYEIAFWDLDGTLVDSGPGIKNSVRYALSEMGAEIPTDSELNSFIGPPLLDSFGDICGFSEEDSAEAVRLYREYYSAKGIYENTVYEGVIDCLSRLKDAGVRLAMATSKPEEFAVRVAESGGFAKYFDGIYGATMDKSRSDKLQVLSFAMEKVGVPDLARAVMIGDRHYDVCGAKGAGIDCIGVLYGYGDREELSRAGARYIVKSPGEVVEVVLKA